MDRLREWKRRKEQERLREGAESSSSASVTSAVSNSPADPSSSTAVSATASESSPSSETTDASNSSASSASASSSPASLEEEIDESLLSPSERWKLRKLRKQREAEALASESSESTKKLSAFEQWKLRKQRLEEEKDQENQRILERTRRAKMAAAASTSASGESDPPKKLTTLEIWKLKKAKLERDREEAFLKKYPATATKSREAPAAPRRRLMRGRPEFKRSNTVASLIGDAQQRRSSLPMGHGRQKSLRSSVLDLLDESGQRDREMKKMVLKTEKKRPRARAEVQLLSAVPYVRKRRRSLFQMSRKKKDEVVRNFAPLRPSGFNGGGKTGRDELDVKREALDRFLAESAAASGTAATADDASESSEEQTTPEPPVPVPPSGETEVESMLSDGTLTLHDVIHHREASAALLTQMKKMRSPHFRAESFDRHCRVVFQLMGRDDGLDDLLLDDDEDDITITVRAPTPARPKPKDSGWGWKALQYICDSAHSYKEELLDNLIALNQGHLEIPMLEACEFGYFHVVQRLLKYGADVNFQHPESQDTVLHILCRSTMDLIKQKVEFLISKGADHTIRNAIGETPLECCLDGDACDVLERLVSGHRKVGHTVVFERLPPSPLANVYLPNATLFGGSCYGDDSSSDSDDDARLDEESGSDCEYSD